jgi:hypothetical protein
MKSPDFPEHHDLIERLRLVDPSLFEWLLSDASGAPPSPSRGRKRPKTFQTKSDVRSVALGIRRRYSLLERIEIIRRLLEPD